jgi:hypothetical protein
MLAPSTMGRSVIASAAAGLLVVLASTPARAGNTEHPRTPVLWPDSPCIHTVDRAANPLFEFTYSIPVEDTLLTVDEFADSRTHQFIGFCRQWPAGQPPPRYISVYDLERAIDGGFELLVDIDDPESTLETSAIWAGCWTRITADDARRPITFEAAAEPVVWDTSGIAAGTWLIAGYTWEPQYNLWSRAPWVVRVLDQDPPNDPVQAAASMPDTADALYFDESLDIPICVDAVAGSSVTLEWAAPDADPMQWSTIASVDLDISGEQTLTVPFVPPEPTWGATVLLRTSMDQVTAPDYAAHALAPMIVYKPADADTGDEETDGGESTGDEDGSTGETGSEGDSGGDPPAKSGRCSLAPERGNLPALLFLGLGLLARRRFYLLSERLP